VNGVRFAAALASLAFASAAWAGTVTGNVTLLDKGGRPASDMSDTVVYIEGVASDMKPTRATMTMKGKSFSPHVVVIGVGGTVEFPNEDPIFHNVFSVSGDNRFDLALYKRPKTGSWTFQHPGVARVYCNIHPQMSALVSVRENPFFVKATADGRFSIDGVPAGRRTVTAWHERGGEVSTEVVVPAEGQVSARLSLDASSYRRLPHKNKYGKDYSSSEEKY
jgi:plastocyanin